MTTSGQDLTTKKGDQRSIRIAVTTTDNTDFTGASVDYAIAESKEAASNLVDKSSDTGGVTIETAEVNALTFRVDLTAAETEALSPGRYWHEARATLADGTTTHIVTQGWHTIDDSIA